jgi:hypothetical protein
MSAIPPTADPSDDDTAEGNSSVHPQVTLGAATEGEGQALGKRVFLLVLNNGTSHAVTDYWVADGYLSNTSARTAHAAFRSKLLPCKTQVNKNAPRDLPFVLRSAPAQNR